MLSTGQKFYNQLYEDDAMAQFKQCMRQEINLIDDLFDEENELRKEKAGLSNEISQQIKELQDWKESQKELKIQRQKEIEMEKAKLEKELQSQIKSVPKTPAKAESIKIDSAKAEQVEGLLHKGQITRLEQDYQNKVIQNMLDDPRYKLRDYKMKSNKPETKTQKSEAQVSVLDKYQANIEQMMNLEDDIENFA